MTNMYRYKRQLMRSRTPSPSEIATELLMLTKMNWNATQLDGRVPITLRTANSIGGILKHLGASDSPQPRYAYYM